MERFRKKLFKSKKGKDRDSMSPEPDLLVARQYNFDHQERRKNEIGGAEGVEGGGERLQQEEEDLMYFRRRTSDGDLYSRKREADHLSYSSLSLNIPGRRPKTVYEMTGLEWEEESEKRNQEAKGDGEERREVLVGEEGKELLGGGDGKETSGEEREEEVVGSEEELKESEGRERKEDGKKSWWSGMRRDSGEKKKKSGRFKKNSKCSNWKGHKRGGSEGNIRTKSDKESEDETGRRYWTETDEEEEDEKSRHEMGKSADRKEKAERKGKRKGSTGGSRRGSTTSEGKQGTKEAMKVGKKQNDGKKDKDGKQQREAEGWSRHSSSSSTTTNDIQIFVGGVLRGNSVVQETPDSFDDNVGDDNGTRHHKTDTSTREEIFESCDVFKEVVRYECEGGGGGRTTTDDDDDDEEDDDDVTPTTDLTSTDDITPTGSQEVILDNKNDCTSAKYGTVKRRSSRLKKMSVFSVLSRAGGRSYKVSSPGNR